MNEVENMMKTLIDSTQQPVVGTLIQPVPSNSEFPRVVAVKHGYELHDMEKYLPAPLTLAATPLLTDEQSFVEYVNQFKGDGTRIYADLNSEKSIFTLNAMLDDHVKPGDPARRLHRATYTPLTSLDWRRWLEKNRNSFDQEAFAEWIEDNIRAIATKDGFPTGAQMMKVATDFSASANLTYRSKKNLQNGQQQITYIEEATPANEMTVVTPDSFLLGIRVFANGDGYELKARLKYRATGAKLNFTYELDRPDLVFDAAAREVISRVAEATEVPLLFGTYHSNKG